MAGAQLDSHPPQRRPSAHSGERLGSGALRV
jgi:hypothetical protein